MTEAPMSTRIYHYLRGNVLGLLAIYLALGGSAVALTGKNRVDHNDLRSHVVHRGKIHDNAVNGAKVADASLTGAEIANSSLTGAKIADGSLAGQDVAPDSLTGNEIDESSLSGVAATPTGPAGGALTGDYPNPSLALDSVGFSHIIDDAVRTEEIADNTIASVDVLDGALTGQDIANGSLGTAELSSSIPTARLRAATPVSVPTATNTPIEFDFEEFDTASVFDGAFPTRLTAPVDGTYLVAAHVSWHDESEAGIRQLKIARNGGGGIDDLVLAVDTDATGPGWHFLQQATTVVSMQAGDYVEAIGFQTSGSTVSADSREFSLTWVAPGP